MTDYISIIRSLKGPILVTGANGFVGANLFNMICAVRKDVFAIVRKERSWRLVDIPDDQIVAVDLNDQSSTQNLVHTLAPQTIFNCAAYGAYSFEENSKLIYETNFLSVVNLIELLSKQTFAAFVHAGSSSEYGTNCSAPDETDACLPNSAYAVSKVNISSYLQFKGKQRNFPCVNLRLYSVYGPLEDTSRLMPNILRHALMGTLPPLVDPRTSRDFVHVDDVCRAFILAASKMNPDVYGESFNIGSGVKTTISDLADIIRQEFKIVEQPNFGSMEGRAWDMADWYANPSKAHNLLGWSAQIPLNQGLRSMSKWVANLSEDEMLASTKKNLGHRKRSLSAIIACYKDGQAIPVMHQRLTDTFKKLDIDYEIIFVNDASPDNGAEVIQDISARDSRVIGITHSRNFGSQMAFRSGMELSTKDGVVLLDGDLQDPPELIIPFFEQWEQGFDVIYGRRIKREMPWRWGILYKAFYRLFDALSYVKIPLDAGDFSLIDRRAVGWLLNCPERDLFVRGLRAYIGFKQTGVDYVRPERMFGVTTNSLLKNIDWAKKGIFSFSNTPLTILTGVGTILLGVSIILALVMFVLRVFIPEIAPKGLTTLMITILIFGSSNLFAIGLVGEYISKIMIEVKGRPRLIRASIIRNGGVIELLPDGKAKTCL